MDVFLDSVDNIRSFMTCFHDFDRHFNVDHRQRRWVSLVEISSDSIDDSVDNSNLVNYFSSQKNTF